MQIHAYICGAVTSQAAFRHTHTPETTTKKSAREQTDINNFVNVTTRHYLALSSAARTPCAESNSGKDVSRCLNLCSEPEEVDSRKHLSSFRFGRGGTGWG